MNVLTCVGLVIFALTMGCIIGYAVRGHKQEKEMVSGDLMVTADPDGYYLSLELNRAVPLIRTEKFVTFKIKDLTQK